MITVINRVLSLVCVALAAGAMALGGSPTLISAQNPTGTATMPPPPGTLAATDTAPASPTPVVTPIGGVVPETVCPNAPKLRLSFGSRAQVVASNEPDVPGATLKTGPDSTLPVARYLPINTPVTVIASPTCDAQNNQWWLVRVNELEGWLTETAGQTYILEPLTTAETPALPTTTMIPLGCIRPNERTLPPFPGDPVLRLAFSDDRGRLLLSDNGDPVGRLLTRFDPPPTSVDLSPEGAAVVVVNRNGVYWVNAVTGETVMLADAITLDLNNRAWPNRALWLPDGAGVAIEVEDRSSSAVSYAILSLPITGESPSFRVDSGAQPPNSLRRSPPGNRLIMLSANDFIAFPASPQEDTTPLLEFVPISEREDAAGIFSPAVSWAPDGSGFYSFIPAGQFTAPDDAVANRLWYVPFDSGPKDLGTPPNIAPGEYVIPSPDGTKLLLGRGGRWRIQEAATGALLVALPAFQYIFDWTPDSKGAIYTTPAGVAAYIGVDQAASSPFLPAGVSGLYGVRWLSDGTILFVVQAADGTFAFGVQRPTQLPVMLATVSALDAFSGLVLPGTPSPAVRPERCP
jgi:hypothetical protein